MRSELEIVSEPTKEEIARARATPISGVEGQLSLDGSKSRSRQQPSNGSARV